MITSWVKKEPKPQTLLCKAIDLYYNKEFQTSLLFIGCMKWVGVLQVLILGPMLLLTYFFCTLHCYINYPRVKNFLMERRLIDRYPISSKRQLLTLEYICILPFSTDSIFGVEHMNVIQSLTSVFHV